MMGNIKFYLFIAIAAWQCFIFAKSADLPCKARDVGIAGRSVVCVCDASYCDTITREEPLRGTFVSYTSSKAGKRFEKNRGTIQIDFLKFQANEDDVEEHQEFVEKQPKLFRTASYTLSSGTRFQSIEGFGGAVTDAVGINLNKLSENAQTQFINTYFSSTGIEYKLLRVPIGGSDFSTHPYTYNEYPINDVNLSNFTLSDEDYDLKLPIIKKIKSVATAEVKITATTWSPPVWMKTNNAITGFGQLKKEYYQSYADYHLRFLEEYEKENVKIWAITTTNEPMNGIIPLANFNSLGWFPGDLGRWVANNLGPTIRNSQFNDTLILAVDDQRFLLKLYLDGMTIGDPKSIDYIDGVAVHYYGNFVPAHWLTDIHNRYPDIIILATEACEGSMPWDGMRVMVGSWERAGKYTKSILEDLNNYAVGWLDWNLGLNENGGPNWAKNYVDAPILIYGDKDEFVKQPMFYAMGHFSKFIPRGSRRIQVRRTSLAQVDNVAVITPEGNIVMVLHNTNIFQMKVKITTAWRRYVEVTLDPESIKTIEINPN